MEFATKKYKISFLGGPTTPTYSSSAKAFFYYIYFFKSALLPVLQTFFTPV